MGRSETDRLMDEAREMLEEARGMLNDSFNMVGNSAAELVDASKEIRKEFDEQVREFRRQAASTKNDPNSVKKPESSLETTIDPVNEPSQWRNTDPLKMLKVDITGRKNFSVLLKAAFKVLFSGRASFMFSKPVRKM